jgi:hypothetical protein
MQHVPADKSRRDVRARGGSLKFYVSSGVYVDQTAIAALWAGFKAFPGLARFQRNAGGLLVLVGGGFLRRGARLQL